MFDLGFRTRSDVRTLLSLYAENPLVFSCYSGAFRRPDVESHEKLDNDTILTTHKRLGLMLVLTKDSLQHFLTQIEIVFHDTQLPKNPILNEIL